MSAKQATWWTLSDGFVLGDEPAAYLAIKDQVGDWDKILKDGGYQKLNSVGNESTALELMLYHNHEGKHLFVQIWNWDRSLSSFFVNIAYEDVFFAEWYLDFAHKTAQIKLAEDLAEIATLKK